MRRWPAILVTLAACHDPAVERLAAIQAEVCACKTTSCAEQALKQVPQGTIKSTHRTQAMARDMLDCLAKLQAAERPATGPDDEEPASAPRTAAPASAGTP